MEGCEVKGLGFQQIKSCGRPSNSGAERYLMWVEKGGPMITG